MLATGSAYGTLSLRADGSFSYSPNSNFFGTDSFTYRASDGQLFRNLATDTITSYGIPEVVADNYSTPENMLLTVSAPGVLANDNSPFGLPLQSFVSSTTSHGVLTLNPDGSFNYLPVTDSITVTHVNRPPIADDDSYAIDEDNSLATAPITTSVQMTSQPGEYVGQGNSYSFTPSNATITAVGGPNVVIIRLSSGTDNFEYDFAAPNQQRLVPGAYIGAMRRPFENANAPGLDVSGDGRGSNSLTGQFTVYQALYDNSGSIIAFAADFVQHSEGFTPTLTGRILYHSSFTNLGGVLLNEIDPNNDPLTAKLVGGPAHGTLRLNPDGSFKYVPAPGFSGTDQFTYKANDEQLDSNVATVTVAVRPTGLIDDTGFESIPVGSGFAYNPTGSAWTFGGLAGVAGNRSGFTTGNPNAPQGGQVAFLQDTGSIA